VYFRLEVVGLYNGFHKLAPTKKNGRLTSGCVTTSLIIGCAPRLRWGGLVPCTPPLQARVQRSPSRPGFRNLGLESPPFPCADAIMRRHQIRRFRVKSSSTGHPHTLQLVKMSPLRGGLHSAPSTVRQWRCLPGTDRAAAYSKTYKTCRLTDAATYTNFIQISSSTI